MKQQLIQIEHALILAVAAVIIFGIVIATLVHLWWFGLAVFLPCVYLGYRLGQLTGRRR